MTGEHPVPDGVLGQTVTSHFHTNYHLTLVGVVVLPVVVVDPFPLILVATWKNFK